ncbi:cytochrome b/b6 domain-containing protein [Variovorax paradoxus]|nr:cytochrome b/b6 domain-containing protein [Variovorax paradoxus]
MRVWDPLIRLLHWSLVAAVGTAWFTGEASLRLHEAAGYAGLVLVTLRLIWGWIGGHFARFSQFVRAPSVVWRYAIDIAGHSERRYLGHNPLGGWMVLLLMLGVASVGATGWLYTLDMFWGLAWLEFLHRSLAWALVGLIALHVAGVVFTSVRHRENLLAAMLTGRKKSVEENDVG